MQKKKKKVEGDCRKWKIRDNYRYVYVILEVAVPTFIKLLCRLYEPSEGRITLNGLDISGGEAQKLALARALYKDAALVIFH